MEYRFDAMDRQSISTTPVVVLFLEKFTMNYRLSLKQWNQSNSTSTYQQHDNNIYALICCDLFPRIKESGTVFHISSPSIQRDYKNKKLMIPINTNQRERIVILFVYGNDFHLVRKQNHFHSVLKFWRSAENWILCSIILVSVTILYVLRRLSGIRRPDFVMGYLEMICVVTGGGNISYRHRYERRFFTAAMVASFFLTSIYLSDFSMHSVIQDIYKVDTFAKLSEHNTKFYLTPNILMFEKQANKLLR